MMLKKFNKKLPNNLADQSAKWEAMVGMFPRPINEQHLSSYAAFRRISANIGKSVTIFLGIPIAYLFAIIVLFFSYRVLSLMDWLPEIDLTIDSLIENLLWVAIPLILFIIPIFSLLADYYKLWNRYLGFNQSESHGTSRYANISELKSKKLLWVWHPSELRAEKSIIDSKKNEVDLSAFYKFLYNLVKPLIQIGLPTNPLENGYLPVAYFGFGRWLCLPLSLVARHMAFLGPPGSGKSASFFIMQARAFGKLGSAVILDLKGEIYRHSSFYYKKVFRIDFQRPETSDRFLLGSLCYNDALAAGEIADLIVGYDPNTQTGGNPFWDESASMLLKCLLLLLAERNMNFTPADIFEFIADHQYDEANKIDRLADVMNTASNPDIRNSFAPFAQLDGRTKSNILISMAAKLKPFQDPTVQKVLTYPTQEELEKGCRVIDPALLRTKGTALYVVVPEGRASQLSNVLGTFFGSVANVLRRTGDTEDFKGFIDLHAKRVARSQKKNWHESEITKCYIEENNLQETINSPSFVLLQFDEAGNIPLRNLSEDIGVGRGRKMCYVLGYQNFDQPTKQYGESVAASILQSIGTKIALTGLTSKTAKYVVELLGKTTTYELSSSDAEDDRFDRASKRESVRDLMSEDELRTMPAYTQAVMISTDIRPLRIGFPPEAKKIDSFEQPAPTYYNPNSVADIQPKSSFFNTPDVDLSEVFIKMIKSESDQQNIQIPSKNNINSEANLNEFYELLGKKETADQIESSEENPNQDIENTMESEDLSEDETESIYEEADEFSEDSLGLNFENEVDL
ncbi:MAG TPA: type IV secretory system conjugative DNA transfer family protein [Pyrinomonadaceae bacterium]|nr:type IV secretory system conjugative DNA transfer family protein [Pyrinomonadaceae bacterium]